MRLRVHVFRIAFVVLISTLAVEQLGLQLPRDPSVILEDNTVVLPTDGTLDERPFFASRRHPAIGYDQQPTDAVGELARKVDDGLIQLRFEGAGGYLSSILEALRVPTESQTVVFSKTSLQSHYISPKNPRAIFFSDDVSVAFIRNAPLLELSALDPKQGMVFYAVEQRQSDRPRIARSDSCLSCHESRNSMDVPGLLARSMAVGEGGETMPRLGNFISDHRSPFNERWGGWFITGKAPAARHMGNTTLDANATSRPSVVPKTLGSLAGWFDLEGYPSQYSDVAAVLVLDHQVRMTNLLTRVGWEARVALDRQSKNPREKQTVERLIAADTRELVDYMLFVEETPLPGKFESTSGFQEKFASTGPRDKKGRSLRQLDLQKRLLRYPCSYMIYSRIFDELPAPAKEAFYSRLWDVLSGKDRSPEYTKLSGADRAAIVTILMETKTDLPAYYRRLER
jgi:hypothetical protein